MNAGQDAGLTFRWPEHDRISFLLPGFIALSAFAHIAMFYLFQVVYPPAAAITPPPIQVMFLNRGAPQNAAFFRWIDAEDPAASARTAEVFPAGLLDVPYKPSYAEARTLPESPPPPAPVFTFPPARSAVELVEDASLQPKPFPKIDAAHTIVRFAGALAQRKAVLKEIKLTTKARADLQPTRILAGVSSDGDVRYAFLQTSSGDAEIDRQAESNLAKVRFAAQPGSAALSWGFVIYEWGAEAYAKADSASREAHATP